MRALHLAVMGSLLAIPSVCHSQDNGPVGSRVGPNLESSPAQPGSSLGAPPNGPLLSAGPTAGYTGSVTPGEVVPQNVPLTPHPGGFGSAFVNGHRVLVDPNSNRIIRVF
jgi:hypothetical protein